MNGKKAKALRRKVYAQMSLRAERLYKRHNGGLKAVGLRAEYQEAKKGQ